MIVRILSQGKSFKGLAAYLTHDPDAKSAERVGWTHTIGLAHDHVASAVNEMIWTARNAELLKQEAGIRAGGRATDNVVKHVSLNWSPEETPTREHMIETAEGFLRHMNWQDHQALVVNHDDKSHAHVHVMINSVHPETGLRLDDNFERRRAQKWALNYEQENGRVFCEQRLENIGDREKSPTRPVWMAFQNKQAEFEREEIARQNNDDIFWERSESPRDANAVAWKKLKQLQRHQRQVFFAEGKIEFSELRRSIYGEVREEFRERWADYYSLQKKGGDVDATAALKKEIIAEQTELLEKRRDEACTELRDARNTRYRELLDEQRGIRHQMRWRQESGLDNAIFLRVVGDREDGRSRPGSNFHDAGAETLSRPASTPHHVMRSPAGRSTEGAGIKSGPEIGGGIATGLGFGILSLLCGIGNISAGPATDGAARGTEHQHRESLFDDAFEIARQRQHLEEEEADSERRRKQRAYGE